MKQKKPRPKETLNVVNIKDKFEHDVDALYRVPLAEFTAARNSLAARLKQAGRSNETSVVKSLAKPSITAWAVNQVYWNDRESFDQLIATGDRFRQAQTSSPARKLADMREALSARREVLSHLSELATDLLRAAGHNPTPVTMLRVTTTLEAMSVYASVPDGPRAGRLIHDVDPPGFDSLSSSFSGSDMAERSIEPPRVTSTKKSGPLVSTSKKEKAASEAQRLKERRQGDIAAAKSALHEARTLLIEAQARVQTLERLHSKANAEAKGAEKQKREAEQRLAECQSVSEAATRQVQSVAIEVKQAARALEEAKRNVEKLSKGLERLFGT